ncbi:hypothetical protein [Mycobacterium uberis]|uniref:hypothetical protein n=1 Tax=Mycobacterium uberis TaxID=2162698 RepID=UPI001FB2709C|nr:hypothetical protein [Mycobacterium uberis]
MTTEIQVPDLEDGITAVANMFHTAMVELRSLPNCRPSQTAELVGPYRIAVTFVDAQLIPQQVD